MSAVNLPPIPACHLTQTLTAYRPDPTSDYGGAFLDPVTIARVRFERSEALNPGEYKLADGAKGRIWVDARNTVGACRLPAGTKVVIDGEVLHVLSCTEYRPFDELHHWEVDVG